MPNEKKDTQSAWFDIAVFAAVVAFFLFSAHSLTKTRETSMAPVLSVPTPEMELERAPASDARQENSSIKTIDVGCLSGDKTLELSETTTLLRLKGSWCEKEMPVLASGRNESSGSEIVTFSGISGDGFTTSYFPLSQGNNNITFELKFRGGKARRENLLVIRSSASK